ncbi:unnamed protein product [Trichogramma brassicae]|uniref:Uncharacterized protein n=1 Tax=Trichogramma brassicae TaxID=86971 RepID=A0A6H5IMQ8_9HYME|nr:unnamed protein product [Trichogramma brassicae]
MCENFSNKCASLLYTCIWPSSKRAQLQNLRTRWQSVFLIFTWHFECAKFFDLRGSHTSRRILGTPMVTARTSDDLKRLIPLVISVRPWTPGRSDPSHTSSASATTVGVRPAARRERAIVVRLASAIARETFLAAAPTLRSMKTSSIFALNEDTTSQLNLSPLLPPARYRLLQKCWAIRKEKRIPNPVIRDMRIYMRRSRDSQLTAISSEADLIRFNSLLSSTTAFNSSANLILNATATAS